jgi:flagellar capping protein FliD
VSATSGTTSATSGTLGDAAPVSFPGIASGIDYNAIIEKYTAETLLQEKPDQAQVNNLNSQNTAILKITNLIGAVQDSLTALSNPNIFDSYKATVGNTASGSPAATATQITGQTPVAGTYVINAQTAATATSIVNNPAANAALITTGAAFVNSGTSITPTNGTASNGIFTINGIALNYDVTVQTASAIVAEINTALQSSDGGSATLNANGTVTLTGVQTIGSGGDSGNLEQVLKLDTAQFNTLNTATALSADTNLPVAATSGNIVVNGTTVAFTTGQSISTILANIQTATGVTSTISGNQITLSGVTSLADSGGGNLIEALGLSAPSAGTSTSAVLTSITSSSNIAGIDENTTFSNTDNAGLATAVTNGTFTINGVQFTINTATDTLGTIINDINTSAAGVTATYNAETSSFSLVNKAPGPQSILLGASGDTSNFLKAVGFLANGAVAAGTTTAGTQASLTYTNAQGQIVTTYSATNDFTNAIPGIDLNVSTSSPASLPAGSAFYTVTVASDPTQAETAINAFIKAYNAAIVELNKDTQAPTVQAGTDATTGTSTSSSSGGGVLYDNYQIAGLKDQLVNLVSGFIPSGSNAYNSLQSVGILLDTNSQEVGANADSSDASDTDTTQSANNNFTVNATSGQLQALDTTTFEAAYAADSSSIQSLFTLQPKLSGSQAGAPPVAGATYGFTYLLGSALANIDGLSTFFQNGVVTPDNLANILLTNVTDSNNQQIDSLEQQIAIINQEATQQADNLRTQFTASESQIAELQALQSQIAAIGH